MSGRTDASGYRIECAAWPAGRRSRSALIL